MDDFKISMAAARVNAGLTQSEVAARMGVGKMTIINWENGKTEPKASQMRKFCEICKCPEAIIFLPRIPL